MNYDERQRIMDCAYGLVQNLGRLVELTGKRIVFFGGIGREKRLSLYDIEEDCIICGCFRGTLAQFEDQVRQSHADNPHHMTEYLGAIEFIKACRAARLQYPQAEECCKEDAFVPAPPLPPNMQNAYGLANAAMPAARHNEQCVQQNPVGRIA